jgi:hypothetical protein
VFAIIKRLRASNPPPGGYYKRVLIGQPGVR